MENKDAVNLSETIYQYVKDMILSLQIKPGERIAEAKIAEQFGISRTPIRDALRMLAHDGIINIYPNRFAQVASYDNEYVKQIGVVRLSLDIIAAKLAIFNGSNSEFLRMSEYAEQCYQAAVERDVARHIKLDCAFHQEMSKISKNQQLIDFQREIYLKIEFIQACQYVKTPLPKEQYNDHCEIMRNLVERNVPELISCLTKHNGSFHNILSDYPSDFFL